MTIDSHHHFWRYSPEEYGWIGAGMEAIRRDFLPADLEAELRAAGVEGAVSVQARQSVAETEWLLGLAATHSFLLGAVGWVPLLSPDLRDTLDRLCDTGALKGVRHVVQGEPDEGFILRRDFNRGVAALKDYGLAYDILIYERHLPQTIRFVDRHPEQRFVVDHVAKPRIRTGEIHAWAEGMRELGHRPNVWCKLSGMVTEADPAAWTPEQLQPYMEVVLGAFGAARVMFGSDWPVCLVACTYARWLGVVRGAVSALSASEQSAILGDNAITAYGLCLPPRGSSRSPGAEGVPGR